MYGANNPRFAYDEIPLSYQIGTNSAVFTKGDFLTSASGFAAVSGAASIPLGICERTVTAASDNQTVAKVEVPFYSAKEVFKFEADFDETETVAYQGYFYQLTGTTGAMLVDQSTHSATVGVVQLEKLDPRREGSTVRGLFSYARAGQGYTVTT